MQDQILWKHPRFFSARGVFQKLHAIHIHSIVSHTIILLLALLVGVFTYMMTVEVRVSNDSVVFEIFYHKKIHASEPSWYLKNMKSVDVMKFTKDTMYDQPSDTEIQSIVDALANNLAITHIAQAIPLDSSADYPFPGPPKPRTATAFTQKWSDAIHNKGLGVIWRGTWSGIEGIYYFPKKVGVNRLPAGTVASAATDGNTTWLGKTYSYIVNNPTFFKDGDIWAIMPERTEGIFQDSTSFLPNTAPGIQANYAAFFSDLKTVSDAAFAKIGKQVITGMTANNFSELNTGWMYASLTDATNIISVDNYGTTHTPEEMESGLRSVYNKYHHQIYLQEWGDYWNTSLPFTERAQYLHEMYSVLQKLTDENILAGFNYWGGWVNDQEGILLNTNGVYSLNERGKILGDFFANNMAANPTQIVGTPPPITVSTTTTSTSSTVDTIITAVVPTETPPTVISQIVTPVSVFQNPQIVAPAKVQTPQVPSSVNSQAPSAQSVSEKPSDIPKQESPALPITPRAAQNTVTQSLQIPITTNTSFPTGTLLADHGTVFMIDNNKKIPFTTFAAFIELGYLPKHIVQADSSSFVPSTTYSISSPTQAHPWHSWIKYGKTLYYIHQSGAIGVSSYEIFLENGGQPKFILKANKQDIKLIKNSKSVPLLTANDSRVNN